MRQLEEGAIARANTRACEELGASLKHRECKAKGRVEISIDWAR
jgi:hypothetical protein